MNEKERIELLMKCYDLTSSQFADRTGIQRASVSHILSGRNKPSLDVMLKIYDAFPGLDMKWLMTGSGDAPVVADTLSQQPALSTPLFGTLEAVGQVMAAGEASSVAFLQTEHDAAISHQARSKVQQQLPVQPIEKTTRKQAQQRVSASQTGAINKRIKEVRIFYTDGTYETLVPEK